MKLDKKKALYFGIAAVIFIIFLATALNLSAKRKEKESKKEEVRASVSESSIILLEEELGIFKDLYAKFDEKSYAELAGIIIKNSDKLEKIWDNDLENTAYYFDGEKLTKDTKSGKFMAIKSASLFFFGDFKDGLPNGEAIALNAYMANSERYEYSKGNFSLGNLSGSAELGTIIIGETDEKTYKTNIRSGILENDAFNGDVNIKLIDAKNTSYTYDINVSEGVLNITDKWEHDVRDKRYRLRSNEDEKRYYTVEEDKIAEKRWINRLIWK